jgi:hypothetical protein
MQAEHREFYSAAPIVTVLALVRLGLGRLGVRPLDRVGGRAKAVDLHFSSADRFRRASSLWTFLFVFLFLLVRLVVGLFVVSSEHPRL